MPAPNEIQKVQDVPLKIVGGNHFGRYPKISQEQTWNMIISDGALVDYAGYASILMQSPLIAGRGSYSSSRGNLIVAVWGSQLYKITQLNGVFTASFRGTLNTTSGRVFFAENNNYQIAITDNEKIYIYNYNDESFKVSGVTPGFTLPTALTSPGYISFQNTRFIVANNGTSNWYLSASNDGLTWPSSASSVGALQSKPDTVQAPVPTPGGGNNLYLFGYNVIEQWQDIGAALFPYQRSSTFNVDYGTVNAASIAALDDYVVFISSNEQSGVALMVIEGNRAQKISTDGIDFKLQNLNYPDNCLGFLFRQDGHIIYQFTFYDDNLSYIYDFNTKEFSTVSDENLDYHPAVNVVFFNNDYYFVSLKRGNLYRFGTQYTTIDNGDGIIHSMPKLRVCPPFRLPNQAMCIVKNVSFTIENGQPNEVTTVSHIGDVGDLLATENLVTITTEDGIDLAIEYGSPGSYYYVTSENVVDLSISRDGGESFGSSYRINMNPTGKRRNRLRFQRLGQANDCTVQLRFSGHNRTVVFDGIMQVYV